MSEVKTVTYEGKVYQIDKLYTFTNDRNHKITRRLKSGKSNAEFPLCDHAGGSWRHIEAIESSELGTITPAPIELVNGNAYMFDYGCIGNRVGVYHKEADRFYFAAAHVPVSACTNIRLMIVGSE
jgi:hypothetical protein